MKSYDNIVLWRDYFNKILTKNEGRKICRSECIFDPSFEELVDAANTAGFKIISSNENARFPKRSYMNSGYIVTPKTISKTIIIKKISEKLVTKRIKQNKSK